MNTEFRFGIEEEYFVNNAEKRDLARGRMAEFHLAAREAFPGEVHPEMLEAQLEIVSPPFADFSTARDTLGMLRTGIGALARERGLAIMASGTHPLATWVRQRTTGTARYGKLMHDLQMVGSRYMVCGLHVHVEVPDVDQRVDVMNRVLPYLPLFLALSTSSPFWQAQRTGLMGYRLSAYRELPRSGLPELFADAAEYQRYVDTLVSARAIENSSFVWWLVRPSLKHPTLELRIADSCTRLDDTLAIAALFRSVIRHLCLNPSRNAGLTGASRGIVDENCWRAQRYGIHGSFVDEETRTARPISDLLGDTIATVAQDAAALGCEAELRATWDILARGTSADRQLALYTEATGRGIPRRDALARVVDWLSVETTGIDGAPH